MSLILRGNGVVEGLTNPNLPDGSVTADDLHTTLDLSGKTLLGISTTDISDYEEGTWTPEIGAVSSNPTSVTHNNSGYYIKSGGIVNVWGYIALTALSGGSGQLTIDNLPFTCRTWTTSTSINGSGHVVYWTGIASTEINITCWAYRGTTQARFNATSAAAGTTPAFNITDLDGSCNFRFYISYPSDD